MWILFALLSALFASIRRVKEKQLTQKMSSFSLGMYMQLAALPLLLLLTIITGLMLNPLHLGWSFWLPVLLVSVGFYPLNTYLYLYAFKHGDLSQLLPLASFGPVLSMLLAWAMLGQRPSAVAACGIVVIVLGVYVLNSPGKYLHNPLKIFSANKPNLLSLFAMVLIVFVGILDTRALQASNPVFYGLISTLGAVMSLFISAWLSGQRERTIAKLHRRSIVSSGCLFGLSYGSYLMALPHGHLAYIAGLRSSAGLLIGAAIATHVLKERMTGIKIVAYAVVITGSGLLIL